MTRQHSYRNLQRRKERQRIEQTARIISERLAEIITILLAMLAYLYFKAGVALWPLWLVSHRERVMVLVTFVLAIMILLSPVIVEAGSNPRPLSGPGRRPY